METARSIRYGVLGRWTLDGNVETMQGQTVAPDPAPLVTRVPLPSEGIQVCPFQQRYFHKLLIIIVRQSLACHVLSRWFLVRLIFQP
jgi:hypothetical protein